jgi:GMP synthase (glutamine-hydrolysing)
MASKSTNSRIAILDAGAQYVDLIRKAVSRLGFNVDVLPLDTEPLQLEKNYDAFIISGGPASTHAAGAPMPQPDFWQTAKPTFGICYGQQAMALALGGEVQTGVKRQDGVVTTQVDVTNPLFSNVKADTTALFTHGDFVTKLPAGFAAIGSHKLDKQTVYSAIAKDNLWAVQFHPEVFDETPEGYEIIRNFLTKCAGLKPDQTLLDSHTDILVRDLTQKIVAAVGKRHVVAFASGGVDSTVATLLATKCLPQDKLHIFYIDNGFMRREDDDVIAMLQKIGVPVQAVNAVNDFAEAQAVIDGKLTEPLIRATDPEIKRKIIGQKFVEIRDDLTQSLNLQLEETILLQGTNAADRIESGHSKGGQVTDVIKTHHNQVQGIKDLQAAGLLIEPLDELFKDEIRRLGEHMGLPEAVVWRQPFPGPGLAIRLLASKSEQPDKSDAHKTKIIQQYLDKQNGEVVAQVLPVRSVGVGGDARTHASALALQGEASWEEWAALAKDLPARYRGQVNRVVIALGENPITALAITPTDLSQATADQLRQADSIIFTEMRRLKLLKNIKQCPVVLLPVSFGKQGERSIVLRPVTTSTFMTVQAMVPGKDLPDGFIERCTDRILKEVPGISQVFLDLTNKPPATTEWE